MYKIIGADQRQYGPVSADQLRQWITEGRADGGTLVQAEGSTDWRPLAGLPEFAGLFAGQAAAAPPPPTSARVPPAPKTDVPTYLPHAIIVTLCCCLPLGIPAIVYAAQVSSRLAAGDVAGAKTASDKARMWFWIALAAGAVWGILYCVLIFSGAMSVPRRGGRLW
jgi:hypothetical protein